MRVTPQYLLGSQLMALKHADGVRCNATPIMNNVYTHMQEPQNLLYCSALAACFSFAVGSPEAWLKVESLGHTCGLDVQYAEHPSTVLYLQSTPNILSSSSSLSTWSDAAF